MKIISFCIMLLSFAASVLFPQKLYKAASPAVIGGWKSIDVNSVNATISYSGTFADYIKTNQSGLKWPKGTTKTAVFTSGLWIIGKHRPTDSLRTAVIMYNTEYQPGKIISAFNTTTNSPDAADDTNKPEYRLYKVTRGIKGNDDENWPVNLGAPYSDVNNNGVWDKGIDNPLKWGDQQLWTVSNDVNPIRHQTMGMTKPLGIELQSTFFAFAAGGAADNTVFMRYKIINKSDADYDSVYISYWSDTDLGDANDDMAGVDTVRNMSYIYNGDNDDGTPVGYGSTPPADGFILLKGPMVFTGNSNDTARSEGKVKVGYKNLPISSHIVYARTIGGHLDEEPLPLGTKYFAPSAFNFQRGFIGRTGQPFIDPLTNQPTRFVFPGDPATNTGWTQDKSNFGPRDMLSMISSGPITFAKGDTQEVVIAFTIAQGTDRLASVTLLKNYADQIRDAYRNDFVSFISAQQSPRIYVEPASLSLSMGKTIVGSTGDNASLQIVNLGKDTLVVNTGSFANDAFKIISPGEDTIKVAGGNSIALKIIFKPINIGTMSDSLIFTTNDPLHPFLVFSVSGIGSQITPVASGVIYATNGIELYTISSSNGMATTVTSLEPLNGFFGMAVRPSTKELIGIDGNTIVRISANAPSTFPLPFVINGYNVTGDFSFFNDSLLMFSADSIIGRINLNTGAIDTVHSTPLPFRISAMSYNASTNEVYFAIITRFNKPDTSYTLYKLNIATEQISRVGRVNIGTSVRSLLFDKNEKLYGIVTLAGSQSEEFVSINTSTGNGTLIGSPGVYQLRILAMDPNSIANSDINDNSIPKTFALEQNYPNPFNPSTTINYSIPIRTEVTLSIFNVLGQRVTTLVNEVHDAGNYSVVWNGKDNTNRFVAAGLYLYQIASGNYRSTKKMLMIK